MDNLNKNFSCWVCGYDDVFLHRQGISPSELTSKNFAITNSDYGKTLSIYKCRSCGFLFCPEAGDVTSFYESLEDEDYDSIRNARLKQAANLLKHVKRFKPSGTLLDVGAASGILVEQAIAEKFDAKGIEPGKWLAEQAKKKNLPIINGTFPNPEITGNYDIVTLVDVIEHINNPLKLLRDISSHLNPDGIVAIATPDVNSIVAGLMGKRWYQYRIGHIGYFNRNTLALICREAGLKPVKWHRPTWYFPVDFLWPKLAIYLPPLKPLIKYAPKFIIPYNVLDNWLVIAKKL